MNNQVNDKSKIYQLIEDATKKIREIFCFGEAGELTITRFIFPEVIIPDSSDEEIKQQILEQICDMDQLLIIANNILRIFAIYIISKYKKWRFDGNVAIITDHKRYNSDERVLQILKGLYHQHNVNYETMQFIILNTQIALAKENSILKQKIGLSEKIAVRTNEQNKNEYKIQGPNLVDIMGRVQKYCKMININYGGRDFKNSEDALKLYEGLNQLLDACRIFENVDITINEEDYAVSFIDNKKIIPTYHLLYQDASQYNKLIYLNTIRYDSNRALYLKYSDLLDKNPSFVLIKKQNDNIETKIKKIIEVDSVEDYYLEITGHIMGNRSNAYGKGSILNYNYKYINKLALAIVDSIELNNERDYNDYRINLKELLLDNKTLFKEDLEKGKLDDDDDNNDDYDALNWDLVLTKLLTFETPTRVLKTLLKDENASSLKMIKNIIVNLNLRLQDSFTIDEVVNTRDRLVNEVKKQLVIFNQGKNLVNEDFKKKWENHIEIDASIKALVDVLSDVNSGNINTDKSVSMAYNCNIFDKITLLSENNFRYLSGKASEIKSICDNALCEVIKVMLCFYAGIVGCVKERLGYETESFNKYLSNEIIAEWQDKIEKAMYDGIKQKAKEISKLKTAKEYLLELRKTASMAFKSDLNGISFNEAIKAILGRNILKIRQFEKYVYFDRNNGDVYLIYKDNEREETLSLDELDEENIDLYLKSVKALLKFFAGINKEYSQIEKFRNMAYPMIVTVSGNTINRDKNRLMKFSLTLDDYTNNHTTTNIENAPVAQRLNEVNISTEFDYQINEKFYCLPNIDRITNQFWADPILIQCEKFNKCLTED